MRNDCSNPLHELVAMFTEDVDSDIEDFQTSSPSIPMSSLTSMKKILLDWMPGISDPQLLIEQHSGKANNVTDEDSAGSFSI